MPFSPLKCRKHASLIIQFDRPIPSTTAAASPPPFSNWFFLCFFSFPAWSWFQCFWVVGNIYSHWSTTPLFHERRSSNCFCPSGVSEHRSPVGKVRPGLQIRAIKPQRPDSFSYTRTEIRNLNTRHQQSDPWAVGIKEQRFRRQIEILYRWLKHPKQFQTMIILEVRSGLGAVHDAFLRFTGRALMIIPASLWPPLKMQRRQDIFCIKFS